MENLIQPKNSLALKIKTDLIKSKIIERVSKFENLQSYRNNQEMLVLICNSIEHLVSKGTKIDKLDLAISICDNLFQNLTIDEKENIKSTIQFIHQNGFIRRVSYYKLFCVGLVELFKSKKKV
jgi:deoxyadenosine/deoxycytidine kinase